MNRHKAWNGFYRGLKVLKEMEQKAAASRVWAADNRTAMKMQELKVRRYCKSLVLEHGWQDVHTSRYYSIL